MPTSVARRALAAAAAVLALCWMALCCTPATRAQGSSLNPSFNLLNRGGSAIVELFVTPAGDARWGQNRLRAPILPGTGIPVRRRIDGNCIFDVRVVFADHRILDRRGLNACDIDDLPVGATTGPTPAPRPTQTGAKPAGDPSFRLLNQSQVPVEALFATPSGLTNWGQNRLHGSLAAGEARLVPIARQPDTCLYDLKVEFADHTSRERHRTDLCRLTDLPVR